RGRSGGGSRTRGCSGGPRGIGSACEPAQCRPRAPPTRAATTGRRRHASTLRSNLPTPGNPVWRNLRRCNVGMTNEGSVANARWCHSPVEFGFGAAFFLRHVSCEICHWPSGLEPSLLLIPGQSFGDSVPERDGADETQLPPQPRGVTYPTRRAQLGVLLPAQYVRLAGQPRN